MSSSDDRKTRSIPLVIDTDDNGGGKQGKVSNRGGGAKLKKKTSRRASAVETGSNDSKPRRKKSSRKLPSELTASLPSNLPSGNALERFNSLSLDEKIALKLSSKLKISDDESSCSSDSEDGGSVEKNSDEGPCCIEETRQEVLDSAKINSGIACGMNINSSVAISSQAVGVGISDASESYEERLRRKLSGEATMNTNSSTSNALDSYEARLRRKLSGEAMPTKNSVVQKPPDTWACKNCTYANKSNVAICAMCQEPKESTDMPASNLTQSVGASPVATLPGAYHVPGVRSSQWECKTCTYKENKMTSLECEICQALNPNNSTINEHDSISGWKCMTCTYQNIDSMTMFCGACGSSR